MKRGNIALIIIGVIVVAILAIFFLAPDLFTGKAVTEDKLVFISPVSADNYQGTTCKEGNIINEDEDYVGIAAKSTDKLTFMDGKRVDSCLKVNFDKEYKILGFKIKYRMVTETCNDSCEGDKCGEGGEGFIIMPYGKRWDYLTILYKKQQLQDKKIWVNKKIPDYILICKEHSSYQKDNLEIDYIKLMVEK